MNSASSSQRVPIRPVSGDGSSRARAFLPGDAACDPDQPTVISQRPPESEPSGSRSGHADLAKQLAGERLNHFQLLEYVGGGGMGAVFRALDTMLNRDVALKVLSRDQGAEEETRRRFQNEAQSAARLDHENIARVYYVGEDRGLNYIVFEFIEGTNLRDLVERNGPLPFPEALSYTLQIAQALSHASGRDVVHRDIKPSNVIITAAGRAKLVDMGLARLHQAHPDGQDLTASGVTLGTFDYISPEQARDPRSADVRSDIYSLGCTLYYMLTCRPPFPDGTVLQKLLQHNSDAPPDPRELDPSLPPGVSPLVAKMLAKDPLRRYQRADELIADLILLGEQSGCVLPGMQHLGWSVTAAGVQPPAPFARHLPWLIPVCLLFLTAALIDGMLPWSDAPAELAVIEQLRQAQQSTSASGLPAESRRHGQPSDGETSQPADERRNVPPPTSSWSSTGTDRPPASPNAAIAEAANSLAPAADGASQSDGNAQSAKPTDAALTNVGNSAGTSAHGTGPTTATDSVPPEPIPDGLLVVGDGMRGPRRFSSLDEACAAAKNGEVVELRYDGPRGGPPLTLHNQQIQIRAGDGRRPTVVFRPSDTNPAATDRAMCAVYGGSLKLSGLDFELDLSQAAPSENWSLFSVDQADALRLEDCSLTVRNATAGGAAYHDKVAFFSVGGNPASEPMVMMPMGMSPLPPVQISLEDCFVRGEADLLIDRDSKPISFSCANGLIAVSERLFAVGEGSAMPQEGARLRFQLDHVTALMRRGLCRVAADEAAAAVPEVEIHLHDSIVLSDDPDPSLVQHVTNADSTRLKSAFHWDAANSVYIGFRTFWMIGGVSSRPNETKTYSDWAEFWGEGQRTRAGPLNWSMPSPRQPLHAAALTDFDGRIASPELLLPADRSGSRAGANLGRLPALKTSP